MELAVSIFYSHNFTRGGGVTPPSKEETWEQPLDFGSTLARWEGLNFVQLHTEMRWMRLSFGQFNRSFEK